MRRLRWLLGGLAGLAIWAIPATPALAKPGDLDTSFGNGGKSVISTFRSEDVTGIALQPDGKILLSGTLLGPTNRDIFVARLLNPQGTLDSSYGLGTGASRLDFGDPDQGGGLVLMPGGQIDVTGGTGPVPRQFVTAQLLNPQGTLDPGFASGTGRLIDRYDSLFGTTGDDDVSFAAARQGSNIIVAGLQDPSGATQGNFAVARVTPSGGRDSFGSNGAAFVDFFGGTDVARDVAVQPDGKVVVVGDAGPGTTGGFIGVARLTADGAPDTSFNGTGQAVTAGFARAVALQPDGKIVVAGTSGGDFILVRFNANGSLDQSFGSGGRSFIDFGSPVDQANDVAIQPDGKIVVAGEGPAFEVARLQPNGSLDTTFGNAGKTEINFSQSDTGSVLALQPDGKIVVAGTAVEGDFELALARLQGDPGGTSAKSAKCVGRKATIVGTNGKDKLRGTKKRDVIAGLGGKDTIKGLGGNDLICGGGGKDKLVGGPGKDRLFGQGGNDKLLGGPGKDFLKGGPGKKDKLNGGPGKDVQKP